MNNTFMLFFVAIITAAVISIGQALYWAYMARQEREQEELLRRLTGGSAEEMQASILRQQENDATAAALGSLGAKVNLLIVASDSPLSVAGVLTRMGVLFVVGMFGGYLILGVAGLILAIPAAYMPYFYLDYTAKARANALVSQLPDALDLMGRSLQAGVGLNDAFKLVAEEMPMPVAQEFGRVFEEVRFGRDYREAFHKMLDRNPGVFDLRLMVSSVLLQRETGGNLIEILENISTMIRARFGFHAKVRAMTAEAKFSAMVLGGLPFAVIMLLVLSSPEYLRPLQEEMLGKIIVAIDCMLYGGGIMIMRDMINVKV